MMDYSRENIAPEGAGKAPGFEGKTARATQALSGQLERVLFGQGEFVRMLAVCLFAQGHALIEGVPGVGKTLAARALSQSVGCTFARVQFTSDMMPSDVVGTNVFNFENQTFQLKKGPVFTQFLLADEINRTPPKTQSALLEAMEEKRVSIDGVDYPLPEPFMVCATQNSIEFEGTYPLPEAQLDRFMMKLEVGYPDEGAEGRMLKNHHEGFNSRDFGSVQLARVLTDGEILDCRAEVDAVRVDEGIFGYILQIVGLTRRSPYLQMGASPRASVALLRAAKALAATEGRDFVLPEDIQTLALPVLRHRLMLTPDAEMDGLGADQIITQALQQATVPR